MNTPRRTTTATTPTPTTPKPTTHELINQAIAATAHLADRTNNLVNNNSMPRPTLAIVNQMLTATISAITAAADAISKKTPTK